MEWSDQFCELYEFQNLSNSCTNSQKFLTFTRYLWMVKTKKGLKYPSAPGPQYYSRNSGPENSHHKVWQDNKVSSCLVIKNFIKLFKKDFLHDWNGDIQLLFINWQQKKSVERVGQYKIPFRNETINIKWLHLKKKSKRYPLTTIERTFIFHFNSSNPK